jgi:hypothetical protein
MILVRYIRDFFFFIAIAFVGWFKVLFQFLAYTYSVWQKNSFFAKISIIVLFLQLVFATRPWFEYKIQFNEVVEVLSVSSKVNLIFIFLSLANFILLLLDVSFSNLMILILQVILGVLFLFGYQSPTSLHIDFINPDDYKFNLTFYIFAATYSLALALSIRNFFKK